ncbi:hypothetical protein CAPTEDRAFT_215231 [Capitella teleta]|uniref:Uncharacterized protein n=1 Tax=Capitella teleta TaxID=283909 RepID=R7VFV7_CAPTE|nr:hypothetical protein CAPTEDRAFT_215231 [Capitella teleta]|eukprot:ELU17457.1 hypothetical protein CAPTEDRAFT_215231 [Capitella teleta]
MPTSIQMQGLENDQNPAEAIERVPNSIKKCTSLVPTSIFRSSHKNYPEAITDSDLASQVAQNPEVNVRPEAPAALTLLSDKLAHIRKVLNSNVQSEIAQSDSGWNANYDFNYKYQTEGSGAPYRGKDRFPNDDEDVDFSGSGSGAGVAWYPPNERPSYRTDSRKGSNSNPNRNPVNSDFNFDDNHDLAPYVTNGPPRAENNAQRGTASSQMKSHSALFSTFIVICISLWFNN